MTGSLQKKNGSKYWYAVISVPWQKYPKWQSTKCTKKTEAKEVLRTLINECEAEAERRKQEAAAPRAERRRARRDPSYTLFTDYLMEWYNSCVEGVMEDTTSDGYLDNLNNHIIPFFKELGLYLDEVRRSTIQDFVKHQWTQGRLDGKGGVKVTSIKKYVANISRAFELAIDDELLENNPCDRVKYPDEEEFEAEFLKQEDLMVLLTAIKGEDIEAAILFAMLYTLRRGEMLGIKWQFIDFEKDIIAIRNNRVRIRREVEKKPKSKASKANMPLIPFFKDFLLKLYEEQQKQKKLFGTRYNDNDYICKHADGRPFDYNYANYRLGKILKENNLPHVTLHGLRHSTATMLSYLGYTDAQIQAWLRHGNVRSTKHYTHDCMEMRLKPAEGIAKAFGAFSLEESHSLQPQ